ncbi:hypothetical protein EV196_1013 [Mariniflexile fucanivorans]|uniref:TonB-dependent receptor-like protein n=1 Tax=Mariniflexile fucanivorans TaxID=264023 RepID=A0A4R1RQR7_9FLAO|nr:hypothetical protein [Mariniflexile fucanivorans]TCL68589.1 hypothetical protein EV196_1013 [Mariniflexile fucanivorans]
MFKKIIVYCFVLTLFSFSVLNNFRELVIKKLNEYTENYPEKIYVQTDKPYYTMGDAIWFSAYLVNGTDHKKSDKSNIIYVELINDKDSIVSQKKLYTNNISAAGDFEIKKEWKPGNYLLRAYTNYMRNGSSDYFFKKEITIWSFKTDEVLKNTNSESSSNIEISEVTERPEIDFYPESGYLINGIPSKVAIKVKDKLNRNISIEGEIKDSDDVIITTFKTYEFGLSLLNIVPKLNKTYYASVFINNKEIKYPLPKALPQGYSLNMKNNGSEIILKALGNSPIGLKNSFLVAHQRGKIVYEKLETEAVNEYAVKLNTSQLLDGVTSFTLFDNSGKPVCERLVFIENSNNKIDVNITKDKNSYKIREKVTLQIDLKDIIGNPISGNLSMSITDLDIVEKNSRNENIKTYLLLNSDLRGYIENPGYFFEKENDPKRRYLLDLIMLTNGWNRFIWNDILYNSHQKNDQFKIEKGLYIAGQTQALKEKGQGITATTRLTFLDATPSQEIKQSSINGIFNFGPYVFYDSIPTLIEARVKDFKSDAPKNRDINILLRNNNYLSPLRSHNNVLKQNKFDKTVLTNFIKQSQRVFEMDAEYLKGAQKLDEILITAKLKTKEEKREEELDDRTSYGGFQTHRLDINDITGAESLSVFDLLRRLPGLSIINDSISIRNGGTPRIILDGFPVEMDDISFLRGSDIEFIDILAGVSASAFSRGGNGVVAIYTKLGNGNIKNIKRQPGIIDFYYPGFYTAKEFYSPDYADSFNDNSKQDIRTTLYWNPKITLSNANHKAEISFFTSDTRSKYAIEIEGLTEDGVPIHHLTTLQVD